ncbi:uncharacterized protein LOC134707053 [Mytilus trossulus]|uniref:uncharacterized protein LOC134707053 n=1 Tax=Mytilus trossulus TaxID=6551 RepID=UPI003006E15B
MDLFNKSVTIMKFLTGCLLLICHLTEIEALQCYSCSYSITGNPMLHYDCITEPWNVTMGTPIIQCPNGLCITKVIYELGKHRVWSADRACRAPEVIDCGDNCCTENSHNIVCQYQCSGVGNAVCNSLNISKPPKNTNGATETLPTIISILASVVLIVFNSCFV